MSDARDFHREDAEVGLQTKSPGASAGLPCASPPAPTKHFGSGRCTGNVHPAVSRGPGTGQPQNERIRECLVKKRKLEITETARSFSPSATISPELGCCANTEPRKRL